MKSKWVKGAAGVCLLVAIAGVGFVTGLAHAEGVPATGALTYTGYIETPDGKPVTTAVNLTVNVWNAATAGAKVCEVTAENVTPVAGRFQVALPDACATAAKASPNLWLELMVDGSSLGRTKLGAVPYALEAGHAVKATNADKATDADKASAAAGGLKTTIDGLVVKGTPSAFRVQHGTTDQSIPQSMTTPVNFEKVDFDLNSEFDLATDTFTPKVGGYYQLNCVVMYNSAAATTGVFRAIISVDSAFAQGLGTDSGNNIKSVSAFTWIDAGKKVTCNAYHNVSADQPIEDGYRTYFEGHRVVGLD